jgi:hypothetical protein
MGLSRVANAITAVAIVTATACQLLSAVCAITVPLAMTSPTTTGARPTRTTRCHGAARNLSHSR